MRSDPAGAAGRPDSGTTWAADDPRSRAEQVAGQHRTHGTPFGATGERRGGAGSVPDALLPAAPDRWNRPSRLGGEHQTHGTLPGVAGDPWSDDGPAPDALPCGVPEAVAPLLHGPLRAGRVLTRLSLAAVLVLDACAGPAERDGEPAPVLTLLAPSASGTPHGLRLLDRDVRAVFAAAEPGCRITVGCGGLTLPGVTLRAARPVASRVPQGEADPGAVDLLRRLSGARPPGPVGTVATAGPEPGLTAVLSGPGPAAAVLALLGRGPGLTPTGDDLLAGLLTGLWATGRVDAATTIGATVRRLAPGRTTTLSADLLGWAARGHAGSELLAVVRAVQRPADGGRLDRAAEALLRVGHTSGADLLAGLIVGLSGSGDPRGRRPLPDPPAAERGRDPR